MDFYDQPIKLNKSTISKLIQFLGPRLILLCLAGALIGISLFGIEFAFVYALQAFFSRLGILKDGAAYLPQWMPSFQLRWIVPILFLLGACRGFLYWAQNYTQTLTFERF